MGGWRMRSRRRLGVVVANTKAHDGNFRSADMLRRRVRRRALRPPGTRVVACPMTRLSTSATHAPGPQLPKAFPAMLSR